MQGSCKRLQRSKKFFEVSELTKLRRRSRVVLDLSTEEEIWTIQSTSRYPGGAPGGQILAVRSGSA
jgi:hypothetical protein